MSAQEEWRPIVGFPDYMVSDLGRVVSYKGREPRILIGGHTTGGYHRVLLSLHGVANNRDVHRLVCAAFHGPRPEGLVVRHLDGNKTNNRASNLTWGSQSENAQDRVRHGTDASARKTECLNGHPFDEANTLVVPAGHRRCRACHRRRVRESQIRRALRAAGIAA